MFLHEDLNTTCFPKPPPTENTKGVWVKEGGAILTSQDTDKLIRDFNQSADNQLYIASLALDDTGVYTCYDRGLKVRSFKLKVIGE